MSNNQKPATWFSRRHETNEAHVAANLGRSRREAKARKRAEAEERNAVSEPSYRSCGHIHGRRIPCVGGAR